MYWDAAQEEARLFLSVLTLGEYDQFIHMLPAESPVRARMEAGVAALERRFAGRILPVSDAVVRRWGRMSGAVRAATGRAPPVIDALVAATAIEHGLHLLTRNVRDARDIGAAVSTHDGASLSPTARDDALALTIAAVDGLRDEASLQRARFEEQVEKSDLLVAALAGVRDEVAAVARRLDEAQRRIGETDDRVQGLRDRSEALEARLRERIESVRADAPSETPVQRAGDGMPIVSFQAGAAAATEPCIIDPPKVEAMRAACALRLNLGCGPVPLDGYVNVDMRALPGVDAVAEAGALPFEPGTVAEIRSSHLLVRLPAGHLRRIVLPHWRQLLRRGGELRAIVPDAEAMIEDFSRGGMSFDDLREVTFGLQERDGDFHFNMFSRDSLSKLVREAGFVDVSLPFRGRRNGKCREMEVRGVRA